MKKDIKKLKIKKHTVAQLKGGLQVVNGSRVNQSDPKVSCLCMTYENNSCEQIHQNL